MSASEAICLKQLSACYIKISTSESR